MAWESLSEPAYEDILLHQGEGIAKITINRPEVRNAFRPETVQELIDAFHHAHMDPAVGVIILTGAGDLAFCAGGDQRILTWIRRGAKRHSPIFISQFSASGGLGPG